MLTPDRLMQLMIELIFILLGGLFVWFGVTHHIFFDRGLSWTILSAALVLWGLRALYKPGQWWLRWQVWTRGLSLVFLGLVMFAMARVPTLWVPRLLAIAGIVLAARGVIGAGLAFRPR